MDKVVIDATTGRQTTVPLTAEEQADADARTQQSLLDQQAAVAEDQERDTLRAMVAELTTYINLTATPNTATIHAQTQRHARILRYLLKRV